MRQTVNSAFSVILAGVLQLALFSCGNEPKPAASTGNISLMNDSLLSYNRTVVRTEEQEIRDLICRYGWQMTESSTGLRYMIYRNGKGERAMKGKKATVTFEVRLLNGTLCYASTTSGPREIVLGEEETEQGLQEGILYMSVGDRAKFIVPSHLAFGLLGDQEMIPPKSTLIYDVELVKLNNP